MKMLMSGLALSLGILAGAVQAQETVMVDGESYLLSDLMANCQTITDPAAQISCFGSISQLMQQQTGDAEASAASLPEKLNAFRAAAQYQDDDSGLLIGGTDCRIHVVYYNNYFHVSRRNVSSIDLFSAQFDASKLEFDRVTEVGGAQAPLLTGVMAPGAKASIRGGIALESAQQGFDPKSARVSMDVYAGEVAAQLPSSDAQAFEFVLIHPKRADASDEILATFKDFAEACRQAPPSWSAPTLGDG